jgi:uncharacterized protein (TIGR02391 family)
VEVAQALGNGVRVHRWSILKGVEEINGYSIEGVTSMSTRAANHAIKTLNKLIAGIEAFEARRDATGIMVPWYRNEIPAARADVQKLVEPSLKIMQATLSAPPTYIDVDSPTHLRSVKDDAYKAIGVIEYGRGARPAAEDSGLVVFAARLHRLVWTRSVEGLARNGHYSEAVHAAASELSKHLQDRTGRHDAYDLDLANQVFSSDPPTRGKPRLRWPGDPKTATVRSMNAGIRAYAAGIFQAIRNPVAHGHAEIDEQVAAEHLASISLLLRWVDQCELIDAEGPDGA